jgi:hypothetical protein
MFTICKRGPKGVIIICCEQLTIMAKRTLSKVSHQRLYRWITTSLDCNGTTVSGWASAASQLKRAQVHDRQQFGVRSWDSYPADRWGWITDKGRCLGAGRRPKGQLRDDEMLVAIQIPFEGSGRELKAQARKFLLRMRRHFEKGAA